MIAKTELAFQEETGTDASQLSFGYDRFAIGQNVRLVHEMRGQ